MERISINLLSYNEIIFLFIAISNLSMNGISTGNLNLRSTFSSNKVEILSISSFSYFSISKIISLNIFCIFTLYLLMQSL